MESHGGMILTGERQITQKKPCASAKTECLNNFYTSFGTEM
jgi:hypothetical protein